MTTFSMNFDFTSAGQQKVLSELQSQGYSLLGYKGAKGPQQLKVGVPTWFAEPFADIFGKVSILYTPTYVVYVSTQQDIDVNTVIEMQQKSSAVELGEALTFQPDGSFVSGGVLNVPSDSIGLLNARPMGTPPLTVGLASVVTTPSGTHASPFCAFTLHPQNSIIMTPLENILLVAAQQNLQSGSVQASVSAPGCDFSFSASVEAYQLMVQDSTYQITNQPGTPPVNPVASGTSVSIINNKK